MQDTSLYGIHFVVLQSFFRLLVRLAGVLLVSLLSHEANPVVPIGHLALSWFDPRHKLATGVSLDLLLAHCQNGGWQ